jgi:hypothetical protein
MTRERRVRMYANHLALMVRGSNGAFKLVERYGKKRLIGTYRTVDTLERGIVRYGDRELNGSHGKAEAVREQCATHFDHSNRHCGCVPRSPPSLC